MTEPQKLEWDIGSCWRYNIENRFTVSYEVIGSRKQLVNNIQRPCHVVVASTARDWSYFDIEVMDVTKDELGLVTDNEIEMTLTMRPDRNYTQFSSDLDGERNQSLTQFLGKETIEIDGVIYENCDKIELVEPEDKRTYWYSEIVQNHVKVSSADGILLMKLHYSGRDEKIVHSVYARLIEMSRSHERRQKLRCIRALNELGDIISFTKRGDLLLKLSQSDDWYVAEKATAALDELSR